MLAWFLGAFGVENDCGIAIVLRRISAAFLSTGIYHKHAPAFENEGVNSHIDCFCIGPFYDFQNSQFHEVQHDMILVQIPEQ